MPELARSASQTLQQMGYKNVFVRGGDGYRGWPANAPFDRIILTAAPPSIPEQLVMQLKAGGKLVAPVGAAASVQDIVVLDKAAMERSLLARSYRYGSYRWSDLSWARLRDGRQMRVGSLRSGSTLRLAIAS